VTGDRLTFSLLTQKKQGAPGITADGIVLSSREIVVTVYIATSGSGGFLTYPVPMILRR
jgi:hypothetical protein